MCPCVIVYSNMRQNAPHICICVLLDNSLKKKSQEYFELLYPPYLSWADFVFFSTCPRKDVDGNNAIIRGFPLAHCVEM